MNVYILGRQPELGVAELESLYGSSHVRPVGDKFAVVDVPVDFDRLGGSMKSAKILDTIHGSHPKNAFKRISEILPKLINSYPSEGKIKLGVSVYGFEMSAYKIGGEALRLKKTLRNLKRSVRVVPNENPALSSAQTYHNQLTSALGMEFVIIKDGDNILIGRVDNVQNIDEYRIRDRERPKRDPFVGMLPPKLAQTIINLAVGENSPSVILDPFCGTGVVLQESRVMGYDVYGSDISPKMIDYTRANLEWLKNRNNTDSSVQLENGDATTHTWKLPKQPSLSIATEAYLGQPLGGQIPSTEKMSGIVHDTNQIIRGFLKNIGRQLAPGSRLCVAVPTWFVGSDHLRLPVISEINDLGFDAVEFRHINLPLIYRREGQVTGRELLILERTK